jgi:hypothetical protein
MVLEDLVVQGLGSSVCTRHCCGKWYPNTAKQSIGGKKQSECTRLSIQSIEKKYVTSMIEKADEHDNMQQRDNAFSNRSARGARAGVGLVSRKKGPAIGPVG